MALLNEYAEVDEVQSVFHHTQFLKKIAYRENGSLLRNAQDWESSGIIERPHQVLRAPIMVTSDSEGMRRMHPTRELDRYIELGAPYVKTGGVWGKVNLGAPTRQGNRLLWSRPQADMYVDFGGHFVKLSIALKGGFVPEDSQIAFPVGMQGFTRQGGQLLREGVPVARLAPPFVYDAAKPFDTRSINGQFVNINGQAFWHMILPDLTGMTQPVIDPTVNLQPDATAGKDTWMQSNQVNTNNGVSTDVAFGDTNTDVAVLRTLIHFDLSTVPDNANISSTVMSLRKRLDFSSTARVCHVYRMLRAWVESQATWNISSTGNNWTAAGGFHASDCDQTSIGNASFTASETLEVAKTWSITGTSKGALDLGEGWMVKMITESNDAYGCYSSDSPTAANRPKLDITYTLRPTGKMIYYRGMRS